LSAINAIQAPTVHPPTVLCARAVTSQPEMVGPLYFPVSFDLFLTVVLGTGGESIYGEKFEDEAFPVKHTRPFLLSMANAGPNTNGSQFFITVSPTPHLDGKHVCFGEVMRGKSIGSYSRDSINLVASHESSFPVRQIENFPTNSGDVPTNPITIVSSGMLSPDDPSLVAAAESADGDVYEDFPDDEDRNVQDPEVALKIAREVRELGNKLFKEGKAEAALAKYQSQCI